LKSPKIEERRDTAPGSLKYSAAHAALRQPENKAGGSGSPMRQPFKLSILIS
jgi:hypothetical protein